MARQHGLIPTEHGRADHVARESEAEQRGHHQPSTLTGVGPAEPDGEWRRDLLGEGRPEDAARVGVGRRVEEHQRRVESLAPGAEEVACQSLAEGAPVAHEQVADGEAVADDLGEEPHLGAEVAVDERRVDACLGRDLADADLPVARARELPPSGGQELRARRRAVAGDGRLRTSHTPGEEEEGLGKPLATVGSLGAARRAL